MFNDFSKELYDVLLKRGYEEEFCRLIATELHTEFTVRRMIGYLRQFPTLPMAEIVDEMLAIEADRDAWIQKKQSEEAQQAINEYYMQGAFESDEECR